jgi:hypothetical protein
MNAGTVTASVAGGGIAVNAGTQTQTSGTLVFANSNGITFGMSNSSQITASIASDMFLDGIAAGGSTLTGGYAVLSNANGVSFGFNGSTITASAAVGTASSVMGTLGGTVVNQEAQWVAGQLGQNSIFVQPLPVPAYLTMDRFVVPVNYSNATNSSGSFTVALQLALYSKNASTLSRVWSATATYGVTNSGTVGNYSLFSGNRMLTAAFGTSITPGDYWIAFGSSTTTGGAAGMTLSNYVRSQINSTYSGIFGQASNASLQSVLGFGMFSATTNAPPASIAFSQLIGNSSAYQRPPIIHLTNGTA